MSSFVKLRKTIKYNFILLFIRFLLFMVKVLPWKLTSHICDRVGLMAYYMLKKERLKTINNLTIAYGKEKTGFEIREMAKEVFRNLGRAGAELAIKLKINDRKKYFGNVEVIGKEHAEKAYARGKGIINIVPHLGCWEALSKAYTMLGFSAGAVAKNLKNEKLNAWVIDHREFEGFKVLPRGSTYKTILQFLKQNNSLGMLIDQDTDVKSVFVDFYGKPAYTPIGAAMLALDSDAAVFTTSYIRTEGNKYQFIFGEAMEVIRTGNRKEELQLNTERFHAAVEKQIKAYPTQWVWMHERWKTTPEIVEARDREKQELRRKRRAERLKEGT
ncbi:MAG: lysophospholipid acyltransferase family protein [Cytophagales bacterium]|nr:lysophospholipid acyltransferase family protein [Cytophagales bacterium]